MQCIQDDTTRHPIFALITPSQDLISQVTYGMLRYKKAANLFSNDDAVIKPKSEKCCIHLSLLPKTHMKFSIYL